MLVLYGGKIAQPPAGEKYPPIHALSQYIVNTNMNLVQGHFSHKEENSFRDDSFAYQVTSPWN
jgi:hypothetical protein